MTKRTTRRRLLLGVVALAGVTLVAAEAYLVSPAVRVGAASVREAVGADDALVGMFADADDTVRLAAREALVRRGPKAVPALVRGADRPEPHVRLFSVVTLGLIGPPAREALAALRARARADPDPAVRGAAISAVAAVGDGDGESIAALAGVLEAGDDDDRLAAARTLGEHPKCRSAGAVAALARRLTDPSAKVREQAAESLGAMAPVSAAAVPALAAALRDDQAAVRAEAAEALDQLAAFARPAVPGLIAALADPDPKVRGEVVSALERVVREWGDGEPALRQRAVDALATAGRGPSP